jgi:hypothetical protein
MASLVYVPAVTAAEERAARELVSSALDAFRGPVSAEGVEGETSAEEHTAEEHTPAADASPSLARAVSVLLLALDALDTARADFNANDAAGRAAEGETDAAERTWSVDQTDENWSRVEDAQRRARQAFLRGRVLLAGLARVEGEFRSALTKPSPPSAPRSTRSSSPASRRSWRTTPRTPSRCKRPGARWTRCAMRSASG